ncbi:MAG: hypothetical protein HRT61_21480, partial [Ekhidna sp.]|nr:hypothetical protein [Ekhidna sp.]
MAGIELDIGSSKVEKSTIAVDNLISSMEKMVGVEKKASIADEDLTKKKKKGRKATDEQTAAIKKATEAERAAIKEKKRFAEKSGKMGKSAAKLSDNLDKMTKQVQLIDGPLGGVASRMTAFNGILKAGNLAAAAFAVGVGLFVRQLSIGVATASATEVALASMNAQVIATGGAAGFSAKELDSLARSLAATTLGNTKGFRDIIGVMGTFQNVSEKAFTRAITLSSDLGLAMRQDPVTAARTLGKVLENPIENYRTLARTGIKFSREEKKRIRLAQEAGDMYSAQAVILEKLEDKVGGVAKAQADTLAGDIDTWGQNWEELWEVIGLKLLPAMRSVVSVTGEWIDFMREVAESDAETTTRKFTEALLQEKQGIEEVNHQLIEKRILYDEQIARMEEMIKTQDAFTKHGGMNASYKHLKKGSEELGAEMLVLEGRIASLTKTQENSDKYISDKTEAFLEGVEEQVKAAQRLTDATLKYSSTREKGFRVEKAIIDAEKVARKNNISLQSDEFKALVKNYVALSDNTEARVRHNTAMQQQKGVRANIASLEGEIGLIRQVNGGLSKYSQQYFLAQAAVEAKNKAVSAGFEIGSKEHKDLEKSTALLALQRMELSNLQAMQSVGVSFNGVGESIIEGTRASLKAAQNDKQSLVNELFSSGEIDEDTFDILRDKFEAQFDDSMRGMFSIAGLFRNDEGGVSLANGPEAILFEQQERLKELELLYQDSTLEELTVYLERKAQINEEFEQKIARNAAATWQASAEHRGRIEKMQVASSIQAGFENLAAAKGQSKDLLRVAKLASIANASISLVDGLAEANKLAPP